MPELIRVSTAYRTHIAGKVELSQWGFKTAVMNGEVRGKQIGNRWFVYRSALMEWLNNGAAGNA